MFVESAKDNVAEVKINSKELSSNIVVGARNHIAVAKYKAGEKRRSIRLSMNMLSTEKKYPDKDTVTEEDRSVKSGGYCASICSDIDFDEDMPLLEHQEHNSPSNKSKVDSIRSRTRHAATIAIGGIKKVKEHAIDIAHVRRRPGGWRRIG
jgi:hypothetical protein